MLTPVTHPRGLSGKNNPLIYLLIFVFLNFLLTYVPLSLQEKFWVILLLFLVFWFACFAAPAAPSGEKPIYEWEADASPPGWLWVFLGILALLVRSWKLGNDKIWLSGDDTLMALYAVEWLQRWELRFFVTLGQDPSTLSYLCWLFLKIFNSPLLAIQFPPILISALTVAVGWAAARHYFSQSLSFILFFLLGFGYWALLISRPLLPGVLMPLWECGVLYFLARLWKAPDKRSTLIWSGALGFCVGLGPYTFFSWPVLYLLTFLVVTGIFLNKKPKGLLPVLCFILSSLLAMLPFLIAVQKEGYGGHILAVSAWRNIPTWGDQLEAVGNYISALFWDDRSSHGSIQTRGGFLNFLLSSFFFLGAIELYRFRRYALCKILAFAFVLSLLPGFLSVGTEFHRILLALPLLLAITALGIHSMVLRLTPSKRIPVLTLVLLLSAGVDLQRFLFPPGDSRPTEEQQCYQALKSLSSQTGPGLIFSEFVPDSHDSYGLLYFTYPFNAIFHHPLPLERLKWAAVFTSDHYAFFLSKRFPQSKWLTPVLDAKGFPSRYRTALIPIQPSMIGDFTAWVDFYSAYQRIDFEIVDTPNGTPRTKILKDMEDFYPAVPDDPFLQSVFFEKLVFNYSWERSFHPEDSGTNWQKFSKLFQDSFEKSCQDYVLCEKFGRLLATEGKYPEARGMFEKALSQNPENPFLKYEIQQVVSWEKSKVP